MSKRRVCLAIGIGDAGGGLGYLSGAVNGAHGMHEWASALGCESTLLTDEDRPVDVALLRDTLKTLLRRGSSTHSMVLYFAGFGLIARADDGLWLLDDWHQELRAVAVRFASVFSLGSACSALSRSRKTPGRETCRPPTTDWLR